MSGKKIIIGIMSISVIVLILIGYMLFQLFEIGNLTRKVKAARDISRQALLYDAKEHQTQVGVWLYFYNPGDERYSTMAKRISAANRQLENLTDAIDFPAADVYEGGIQDVKAIKESLGKVQTETGKYFEVVAEYRKAEEAKESKDILDKKYADLVENALECEKVFNSFRLNENINNFSEKQIKYTDVIDGKLLGLQERVKIVLLALAAAYLALMLFIAAWLWGVIKMVKEKNMDICKL